MSPLTNAVENRVLDELLRAVEWSTPAPVFLGLSTTVPTKAGTGHTEPTATGGYARVAPTTGEWDAAAVGATDNNAILAFPESTAAWSTGATNLIEALVFDIATLGSGEMQAFGTLVTPRAVNAAGITLQWAVGAFDWAFVQ